MNLQDVFVVENLTILNEGKSGPLKIRGIFQRADEANHNNRIYPKKVLENQVNHLVNAINERRLVGELDHPTYEMVKLSNASHLITGLRLQGNEVIGEAEILPTPAGKVVEGLIRGGVKIGISSRGMGTLSEGRNGTKTVNEDFKLVTFDIVADPSTRGAYPTLSESIELKKEKKIIESTIKTVVGERYFLKLLEKRINEKLSEGARHAERLPGSSSDDGYDPDRHRAEVAATSAAQDEKRRVAAGILRQAEKHEAELAAAARRAANKKKIKITGPGIRVNSSLELMKGPKLDEGNRQGKPKQKKPKQKKPNQTKPKGNEWGLPVIPPSTQQGPGRRRRRQIDDQERDELRGRY
jgi:hypothetical protein